MADRNRTGQASGKNDVTDTIFGKIIKHEVPADIVYEDDRCLAFRDNKPQAPIHVLIIPRQSIEKVADACPDDREMLGHLLFAAGNIARLLGCEDAFRLVVNNGAEAGQSVFHLHVHLLAGRVFSWPPG